jgi:5-oxopent-3-ene-1,2,5-tricarboxylate decarboxylase/2-hydroxyhepta-2,4-diene-1,7-dioate isomerase
VRRARIAYAGGVWKAVAHPEGLRLSDGRVVAEEAVVWLPPVQPRTILALGLNYADHAKELAFKAPDEPLVFLKGPNTLIGHRGVSRLPAGVEQMHYECELVAVIGKTARRVKRAEAYDHIAGYTVANDYALREYLENYYRPNLRVKNRDGCTPLGPWLVDAEDIGDPMDLALRTTVNGELVQSGSTRDMIFDLPYLIEYFSSFMTLQPGDIILTGTPDGVRFLKSGDRVVTEIDGVGRLENTVLIDDAYYQNQKS